MRLVLDATHHYEGYSRCPSRCHLRVYRPEPGTAACPTVVIATQYWDNPGTSITNLAEDLASSVWKTFGRPSRMVWIENYEPKPLPPATYGRALPRLLCSHPLKSEFDRVDFEHIPEAAGERTELVSPQWRAMTRAEVEALVGQPVAPVQGAGSSISPAA